MAGGGDGVMRRDVGECWSRVLPSKGLVGTRSGEVEEIKKKYTENNVDRQWMNVEEYTSCVNFNKMLW